MADETALNIILRFITDLSSQEQAKKAIQDIQKNVSGIGQTAQASTQSLEQIARDMVDLQQLTGNTMEEVAESFAFSTGRSKEELLGAVGALGQVEQKTEGVGQAARRAKTEFITLGRDAQRLNSIGITFSLIGAAISGPFILSARNFVRSIGLADETSRQWLDTTHRLEIANLRIGRVAAEAILPVMERIADVVERGAQLAEENPEAVRNVLAIGGALVGIGAFTTALGRGIKLVADVRALSAAALQNTAADKMFAAANIQAGAAAAQRTGGASGGIGRLLGFGGIAGAGIGFQALLARGAFGIGGSIADLIGFDREGAFRDIASRIGGFLNSPEIEQGILNIGRLAGMIDDLSTSAQKAEGAVTPERIITPEAIEAFIDFRRQEVEAERQYGQQRAALVEQFGQRRVEIERQYEQQRAQLIRDFTRSQAQALSEFNLGRFRAARDFAQSEGQSEAAYYDRRRKLAEQFQIDVQRAEEDHQRRIRNLREDHEERLDDLADERDALGIIREQEKFEKERRQLEEEFQVEASRRSEDFARRIAEMEQQFAQERASRLAQFQQRQADEFADFQRRRAQEQALFNERLQELDDAHKVELEQLETQKRQELQALDRQYQEERVKRQQAFADQLRDLGGALGFERDLRNDFYAAMAQDLAAWIAVWEGQVGSLNPGFPTAPSRQFGGYTSDGLYRLHEGEFVVNPQTTRSIERMMGSRLTQERIMAAVAGGGITTSGGRSQIIVYQQAEFRGTFTERDRKELRRLAEGVSEGTILDTLPL